jgi:extracellular factor (EF) 3-hydroxypalmitic acid methyl ester biosynthesis protein
MLQRDELFSSLSEDEHARLLAGARRLTFAAGETILAEGAQAAAIYVLRYGSAHVEREHLGRGIAFAQLGAGEVFGEISFLQRAPATGSVIADDKCEVEMLDRPLVEQLLSVPVVAAAFYRTLALALARRLRETSALLPPLLVEDVPQVTRLLGP